MARKFIATSTADSTQVVIISLHLYCKCQLRLSPCNKNDLCQPNFFLKKTFLAKTQTTTSCSQPKHFGKFCLVSTAKDIAIFFSFNHAEFLPGVFPANRHITKVSLLLQDSRSTKKKFAVCVVCIKLRGRCNFQNSQE